MSSSTCPACHTPVAPGSTFCTRCGAVLNLTVVDAGVDEAQRHWGGARRPAVREQARGGAQGGVAVAAPPGRPATRPVQPLGPAFDGVTPATTGRRVAAVALDLVLVLLLGAAVLLLTESVLVATLVVVEAAVAVMLAEARTGATPGQLAVGLRTAQLATPYAPGLGRATVRGVLVGASALVPVLGPLGLALTAGLDGTGRRRAWHDLASGCVVVDVRALRLDCGPGAVDDGVAPLTVAVPEAEVPRTAAQPGHAVAEAAVAPTAGQPDHTVAEAAPTAAQPAQVAVRPAHVPQVPAQPDHAQPEPEPEPEPEPVAPAPPTVAKEATPEPSTPGAVASPTAGEPAGSATSTALYVVTLDTGEAMSVSGPGVVGRRPVPTEGERCDHAIAIDDPGRSLSRTHARFGIGPEGFWVEDLASANGTRVEAAGAVVEADPGQRVAVPDGATVHLGDRTFTVVRYS